MEESTESDSFDGCHHTMIQTGDCPLKACVSRRKKTVACPKHWEAAQSAP